MSERLAAVQRLVAASEAKILEHGYDEFAQDRSSVKDVIEGIDEAAVVQDYPTFPKGPAVLVLQSDSNRLPLHLVWGYSTRVLEPGGAGDSVPSRSATMERGFPGEVQDWDKSAVFFHNQSAMAVVLIPGSGDFFWRIRQECACGGFRQFQ